MVCPKCGKDSEIDVFCRRCFLERNLKIELPTLIEIPHCTRCGTYTLGGKELEFSSEEDAITEAVQRSLKGNFGEIEGGIGEGLERDLDIEPLERRDFEVVLTMRLGEFSRRKRTVARIKDITCSSCGKKSGGYWEALLQLRGNVDEKTFKGVIKDIESSSDENSFVSRVDRLKKGYDVYVGSKKTAEKIVKNFRGRAEIKKSSHLVSVDRQTSKSTSRFTYLVRI